MNFKISELELVINDALIEKAEQLCTEKRIHDLIEIDKNLWVAQIDDNQGYEVEVKLVNQRLKNATCDCIFFNKQRYCKHVTAVILQLRTFFKAREFEQQKKRAKSKSLPTVLRTSTLLKHVNESALQDFVRSYARNNAEFEIALKLHFASVVPFESHIGKYRQILEKIFTLKKMSPKNLIQFKIAVKKLLEQAASLKLNENIAESIIIYKAILLHVLPFLKSNTQKDHLEIMESIFIELANIQSDDLAPLVKDELFRFYTENAVLPVIVKTDFAFNYIDLASKLAIDSGEKKCIVQLIDTIISQEYISESLLIQLLLIKLSLVEDLPKALESIVQQYADNPGIMQIVVTILIENGQISSAKELILVCTSKLAANAYFDEKLLEIAILENEKKQIITYASKRLISSLSISYYYILAKAAGKRRNRIINELLKNIEKLPFSIEKRNIYASILCEESKTEALINYIDHLGSFDLLLKYDDILISNGFEKPISIIYQRLISEYLNNHIGEKAALKIKSILMHLINKKNNIIIDGIVDYIRVTYPKRSTLIQTLQELNVS